MTSHQLPPISSSYPPLCCSSIHHVDLEPLCWLFPLPGKSSLRYPLVDFLTFFCSLLKLSETTVTNQFFSQTYLCIYLWCKVASWPLMHLLGSYVFLSPSLLLSMNYNGYTISFDFQVYQSIKNGLIQHMDPPTTSVFQNSYSLT